MSSKRFKKLPENTKNLPSDSFEKLLPKVKENCTTRFDESIDLNFHINNKQKKKWNKYKNSSKFTRRNR